MDGKIAWDNRESSNDFKTVSKPAASSQFSDATEQNYTRFPGTAGADFPLNCILATHHAITVPAAIGDPSGTRNQVGSHCVHLSVRTTCQEWIKPRHQRPQELWYQPVSLTNPILY